MHSNARGERCEIITALERGDDPPSSMTISDLEQLLGDPSIVPFFEQQLRQRVALMRVKARRDQHQLGTERVERREDALRHTGAELARAGHRPKRHVDDVADAYLVRRSGPRIKRRLMRRGVEEAAV